MGRKTRPSPGYKASCESRPPSPPPDFGERAEPGVLLTGVMPGSPAEKAGLKAGDVVVGLGGTRVLNLQDLQYALGAHRPGDLVALVYQRDGRELTVKVTLAERK